VAPEILQERSIDRRADVWSMGVMAWELLTRRRLFSRDVEVQTLCSVLWDEIPPPSHVDRWLTSAYDQVVMTALCRDPNERYPTARDFQRALERALIGQGRFVDPIDMREWMDALFPSGRAIQRAKLELADAESAAEASVTRRLRHAACEC
jgi:serine/threonine-protein kinase